MKWTFTERYIKLIISGFTLLDGEVYVAESFLHFLGMKNSILSLISQSKRTQNGRWVPIKSGHRIYIKLNSIPDFTQKRLGLDFPLDYLKELLFTNGKCIDENLLAKLQDEAYLQLNKEVANYGKYIPTFYDICENKNDRIKLALNYAILKVLIAYTNDHQKGMVAYLYNAVKLLNISGHSIPLKSANYFYKYLTKMRRAGIPHGLIHGLKGKPSNNLKLTKEMKELIIYLKCYGNFTSCREIERNITAIKTDINLNLSAREKVNIVSDKTISSFLATKEADNITLLSREGYKKFESKILGYLPLNPVKSPLSKIMIDGYVIQVICSDEDQEPTKLVMFSIMDSFSGYVSIEIGESENYDLLRKGFEKFLRFTECRLPHEIVTDFHSSRQSKYLSNFMQFTKDVGVKWVATTNPKRKGQLERWFSTLQMVYLTKIPGYVGEGIKSRRKDAHPPEEVQLIIRSKTFLRDRNELCRLIYSAVDDYCRNAYFKDAASPLDLYKLKQPQHFHQLQEFHIALFFWEKHEVTINGSMVIVTKTIDNKVQKWFYRNTDFEFALKNGLKVDAYHNPDNDHALFLFKENSFKFIKSIPKMLKANQALAEQTAEDRKIIADFGISKAKLHQAFMDKIDEITENLQEVFGVNPEQLRREADFKKQAKESSMAEFKKDPDLSKPYKYRKGRVAIKNKKRSKSNEGGIFDTL